MPNTKIILGLSTITILRGDISAQQGTNLMLTSSTSLSGLREQLGLGTIFDPHIEGVIPTLEAATNPQVDAQTFYNLVVNFVGRYLFGHFDDELFRAHKLIESLTPNADIPNRGSILRGNKRVEVAVTLGHALYVPAKVALWANPTIIFEPGSPYADAEYAREGAKMAHIAWDAVLPGVKSIALDVALDPEQKLNGFQARQALALVQRFGDVVLARLG